jgi:hypothetical protein
MICTIINNKVKCMMNNETFDTGEISPLLLIIVLILVYIITVSILQFAWNNSVSRIFNVSIVSFSEAFGLLIVSMILFRM